MAAGKKIKTGLDGLIFFGKNYKFAILALH
ncbi:hypothetical protein THIARS_40136 [Thiomonas delicata]|uniref:Uncharacterized protein n=1 Tax=Thiomonas delicata TaxID=364030 RepID=A0A238CZV9_THIDL|nr:hypothetical protein THIARS_40136 [Thiomonas delicata]